MIHYLSTVLGPENSEIVELDQFVHGHRWGLRDIENEVLVAVGPLDELEEAVS